MADTPLTELARAQRARAWPTIERFFGDLPPRLFQQSILLRASLAAAFSEQNQFDELLRRATDYPHLDLPIWLLTDLQVPDDAERRAFETALLSAGLFSFAARYLRTAIADPTTVFDFTYHDLATTLERATTRHFAQWLPPDSPFWNYRLSFEKTYIQAQHAGLHPPNTLDENAQRATLGLLAPAKNSVVASILFAQQTDSLPQLLTLFDHINDVWEINQAIANLRRDLAWRHYTAPIIGAMQAGGLTPTTPIVLETLLGVFVLGGGAAKLGEANLARLNEGRAIARALRLPTITTYLDFLDQDTRELSALFSLKALPTSDPPRRRLALPATANNTPLALQAAERYLLADRTFKASWEIQRSGSLGSVELVGSAFPTGLICEILAQHDLEVGVEISTVFQTLAANHFRYYAFPALPPDADCLGLLLRLYPAVPDQPTHQSELTQFLAWLEANLKPSGQIPCWFTQATGTLAEETGLVWGGGCATVEANVLLGLLAYNPTHYAALINKAALHWLDRMKYSGLGLNAYYVMPYTLWTALELLKRLTTWPAFKSHHAKITPVLKLLTKRLRQEAHRADHTPQEAAFLLLAAQARAEISPTARLVNPHWTTTLLKHQRYDGSWVAEALYICPTWGNQVAWYSSALVTTAFCYHALKRL